MKSPVNLLLGLLMVGPVLRARDPIEFIRLDERVVIPVPVATNRVTTLAFPGPITAIDAALVTMDPKVPGHFQLSHAKGSSFLSLRAITPGARANLNVRLNQKTYVFQLAENQDPVLALNLLVESSPPRALPAPRLSTSRLLALLDKVRAFPLLKEQHPDAVRDVEVRTFTQEPCVTDLGDFEIRIEELYRFEQEDTLVFRLQLVNKSDSDIHYDPGSFTVRAGDHLYPQAINDAPGFLPRNGVSTVHLAITGSPDGSRASLSLKNEFSILVTQLPPSTSP